MLTLSIGGCIAPGKIFTGVKPIPQGSSEVIIYRNAALLAFAQTMPVLIDDTRVGELYNASYLQVYLMPGPHTIKVTTGMFGMPAETLIQIAAGERKYLHFYYPTEPIRSNVYFIGDSLTERNEADALNDLKSLKSAK